MHGRIYIQIYLSIYLSVCLSVCLDMSSPQGSWAPSSAVPWSATLWRLGHAPWGNHGTPAVTACYGHRIVRESDDEVDFRDAVADHISWLPVSVVTFAIFLHGYWWFSMAQPICSDPFFGDMWSFHYVLGFVSGRQKSFQQFHLPYIVGN